jgi:hypothetical protein
MKPVSTVTEMSIIIIMIIIFISIDPNIVTCQLKTRIVEQEEMAIARHWHSKHV